MAFLLHIESATENCSVAISRDNKLLSILSENETMRHSEIITILITRVLEQSGLVYKDLSAVSVSEGPGSYTSLRVGTSAAKAICYAMDLPLISVNTLYSLASSIDVKEPADRYYFSMIDARRMEVYGSLFDSKMKPVFENIPIILDDFDIFKYVGKNATVFLSGNGSEKAKQIFKQESFIDTNLKCNSGNLVNFAYFKYENKIFEDIAYFSPNYIKPPNITLPKSKTL